MDVRRLVLRRIDGTLRVDLHAAVGVPVPEVRAPAASAPPAAPAEVTRHVAVVGGHGRMRGDERADGRLPARGEIAILHAARAPVEALAVRRPMLVGGVVDDLGGHTRQAARLAEQQAGIDLVRRTRHTLAAALAVRHPLLRATLVGAHREARVCRMKLAMVDPVVLLAPDFVRAVRQVEQHLTAPAILVEVAADADIGIEKRLFPVGGEREMGGPVGAAAFARRRPQRGGDVAHAYFLLGIDQQVTPTDAIVLDVPDLIGFHVRERQGANLVERNERVG